MSQRNLDYRQFLAPRYWPLWVAIGLGRLVALLPLSFQYAIGSALGWLAYHCIPKRRRVTATNIAICFPELDEGEQGKLVKKCFRSGGIGMIEAVRSWSRSPESLKNCTEIHGLSHLNDALEGGKGVILLGAHYSTLDLVGSLTTLFFEADVLQRDHSNPLFNAYMTRSRAALYGEVLNKTNMRGMLKRLRQNKVIWYATDQDAGLNNVVFAPFFGRLCSTLITTARLADRTGAAVVPFSHFRRDSGRGYDIYIHPALKDFPSKDEVENATRLNKIIENELRKHPDQYLWMHRRFKTQASPDTSNPYQ